MLDHILVTLDGSELSEKAIQYARQIVNPTGTITLLSVIDIPANEVYPVYEMGILPPMYTEKQLMETETHAREYLWRIASKLEKSMGVQVSVECIVGEPSTVIVDQAKSLDVDAVVMSTHGRSGINRWIYGSVTRKVLDMLPCPIFVVPGRVGVQSETTPVAATASV